MRHVKTLVTRLVGPLVWTMHDLKAPVLRRIFVENGRRIVCRPVVDTNNLDIRYRLACKGIQALAEEIPHVVDRNDDADKRTIHLSRPLHFLYQATNFGMPTEMGVVGS